MSGLCLCVYIPKRARRILLKDTVDLAHDLLTLYFLLVFTDELMGHRGDLRTRLFKIQY